MRNHLPALLVILFAAVAIGCGSSRDISSSNEHANQYGCDQCHGYPPPPHFPAYAQDFHPIGVTGAMCYVCHPTTVNPDGHTIVAGGTHKDGQVEYVDYHTASCDACHGLPPETGRHTFHVTTRGVPCSTCHQGFDPTTKATDDTVHMQGLDYIVLGNGTHLTKQALPDGTWPDAECAACHSALGVD
ncbi:MAG TPA: hypothetical protein VMG58_01910 [Candidatus Sulfotelmatobacter sp.]|nr:hypothetical protein [Candidatus Sulfotelmatobacter sp.]